MFLGDFGILLTISVITLIINNTGFFDYKIIYIFYTIFFILLSHLSLFINELYSTEKRCQINLLILKCIISFVFVSIASHTVFIKLQPGLNFFNLSLASCFLILLWRIMFYKCIHNININHRILFLGTDELSKMVVKEILAEDNPRFKVVGLLGNDQSVVGKSLVNPKFLGMIKDLKYIIKKEKVGKLIISRSQGMRELPAQDLIECKFNGIQILELHTFYEQLKGKILLNGLRPSWLIFTDGFKKTYLLWKRIIDILISVICLLLTFPIILFSALLIKLESPGPIFYMQERVGENGYTFKLIKFRSMKEDAEKFIGPVWARENDPRMTRIGKFMRKLHIDEIPQMINVLRGDMSFVGPRPERPFFVKKFKKILPYYDNRTSVKPGITGWAAVKYGYGASVSDALEKLQYDLYYIKNMSLFLDLIIILKTVSIIIERKGAR